MDRGDVLYALGGVSVSAGVACVYWPAGLMSVGVFLALPAIVSLFSAPRRDK